MFGVSYIEKKPLIYKDAGLDIITYDGIQKKKITFKEFKELRDYKINKKYIVIKQDIKYEVKKDT